MSYRDTLFTPLKIGQRTCANRFFAAPIECGDADPEGNPSALTRARYERLFSGGWGVVPPADALRRAIRPCVLASGHPETSGRFRR